MEKKAVVSGKEISIGTAQILDEDRNVEILNPDGCKNHNCQFGFLDFAFVHMGKKVVFVGFMDDSKSLCLVRYFTTEMALGTAAPSGTLFAVSTESFLFMTDRFNAKMKKEKALRDKIGELLKGEAKFLEDSKK
ncbi:MAG: hypothetical protein WCT18_01980 [Patescibacteria group bacterium]